MRSSVAGPQLRVFPTPEALAAAAAALVAKTVREMPHTRLALAGGATPRRCYELIAEMELPWGRVTVLFGDERCVPPSDPQSNYRTAVDALLRKVAPASVHRIPAELGAEEAAAAYEPLVAVAPIDLILLGLGPDGHTAALFPDNPALSASGYVTAVHDAPKPPPDRVSLTLRALREARRTVFLVSGTDKAQALRLARAGAVPAGLIPRAVWLVTSDVAADWTP